MILEKKIPAYLIPNFQQGGLVFRDNMYTQPIDSGALSNILITPASQGFAETQNTLENIQKGRQLDLQEFGTRTDVVQKSIANEIDRQQLDLRKKAYEDENLRYILKERAAYVDKVTGDDLDPIFSEKIKTIQDKHQITKDRPMTMEGLAEQQKAIFSYYNDPEYKNIKEYSTLIKHISGQADVINSTLMKYKLEEPDKFIDYNMKTYEEKVTALRKNLINIKSGDFNNDGILDQNDMNVLKQGLSDVKALTLELTPEAQQRISFEREIKLETDKAKLNLQQLNNKKSDIQIRLLKQQTDEFDSFVKVMDDPKSTDEDKINAKNKLAAVNKKISEISGLGDGGDGAPKNEWELYWRAGAGDQQAINALKYRQDDKVDLKATPTSSSSTNTFTYDTDPDNGKQYKQKGSVRYYNGYVTDLGGKFKFGNYGPNGTEIQAKDVGITEKIQYNENGQLVFEYSDQELMSKLGIKATSALGFGNSDAEDIKEQIPGADKKDGKWYIPPKQDAAFDVEVKAGGAGSVGVSQGGKAVTNTISTAQDLVNKALEAAQQ